MPPVHYHAGKFPPENLDLAALFRPHSRALEAITRYDVHLANSPNPELLLTPLLRREAVLSSRIEGTQASVSDVLLFEAGEQPHTEQQRDDVLEIINYHKALAAAEKALGKLPLCERVILDAHRVLMSGARGKNKTPGQYRKNQNWIGPPGCTQDTATFVPISVPKLSKAMSRWEKYIHTEAVPGLLIQAALLHAEFEALHPFLDGNGRIGRLLIPLFLWQRGLIHRPIFYLSAYFEAHRSTYYERLLAVSKHDDWTGWCEFFLEGVHRQAQDDLEKVTGLMALYETARQSAGGIRMRYALPALDWIFANPVFRSADFVAKLNIPEHAARDFLRVLVDGGILAVRNPARGRRSAILTFPELIALTEN